MENDGKSTGVCHNNKITGVDSDNDSKGIKSVLGSTGATNEADGMTLEEAIVEAERDIAEGKELLAGAETKTEDTRDKNVIHLDFQVPKEEHTYNFRRRGNLRPDYTHGNGFQATIIHYALTHLPMKCGLKKFKQKVKKVVIAELEQLHRRD